MLRRRMGIVVLICFAAGMVVILMLDDPAAKQAQVVRFEATRQAERGVALFPELSSGTQVDGLEVLDVTSGTGLLLVRDEQGLWYAPEILGVQAGIAADALDQSLVEQAAASLLFWVTQQWYTATPENLDSFGFEPEPGYIFRFRGRDEAGAVYESVRLEIGDANPDHVAYYVWPQGDQQIYLITKTVVDVVLNMLNAPVERIPTPSQPPEELEVLTPTP